MYTEPRKPVRVEGAVHDDTAASSFVLTSVARSILAYAENTHRRGRISCISGPPGIGKTAAIQQFRTRHPGEVAIAKVGKRNATPTACLREMVQAVRHSASFKTGYYIQGGLFDLRNMLYNLLCQRDDLLIVKAHNGNYSKKDFTPLTIIFDEAQNLSREWVDMLRYWNDSEECYAPFPISFLIVGNSELILRPDTLGDTHISRAIGDRLLHSQVFEYGDVSDDDLLLVADSRADLSDEVRDCILVAYSAPKAIRSLRTLGDALELAADEADGGAITPQIMMEVFAILRRSGRL